MIPCLRHLASCIASPCARLGLLLGLAAVLAGCTLVPLRQETADGPLVYRALDDGSRAASYAPVFVIPNGRDYNRIGTPVLRRPRPDVLEAAVDPARPVFYVLERTFESGGRRYTNFVYRVHFPRVPYLHLTSGRNSGLLVVITVAADGRPLLVTTVHSCGCYLAFVPTSYLPESAYPKGWNVQRQRVYGIELPGRLDYPPHFRPSLRPAVFLRDATHRVEDVRVVDLEQPGALARLAGPDKTAVDGAAPTLLQAPLRPMAELEHLPLPEGGTASFFYTEGPSRGYVRNAFKPFELLLMSWWVLDPHVGMDKRYGDARETGTVFYTSLWPWYRKASDMWEFADFLRFWGWRL